MIKHLVLLSSLAIVGCKTVSCEDYIKDQMTERAKRGRVPLEKIGDSSVIIFGWLDQKTLEIDGLAFLFPTHPDYKKTDLGLPQESEVGVCRESDVDIRIVGFHAPMPNQAI